MDPLPPETKERIVREARRLFRARFPDVAEGAACLYLTLCVIEVAYHQGIKLSPQAGSASWRRVRPDQDDGVCCTHFSYMWEPDNPQTMWRLTMGMLPEMHVWAADPERREIIDLTTRDLPQQCSELAHMDWPGDKPPDHLWCGFEGLPEGTHYTADRLATSIAGNLMVDIIEGRVG